MKILRLALINYKRMVKDIGNLAMLLIMPLVIILGVHFMVNGGDKAKNVNAAFNIQDMGRYGEEIVKGLSATKSIYYNNREEALKLLENNDIAAVYEIPSDFSERLEKGEKPQITSYKRESGNITLPLELSLNDSINKRIKEKVLLNNGIIKNSGELYNLKIKTVVEKKKKSIDSGLFLTSYLIIYFIILAANNIGGELMNLRKQKVLARAITTANRGYEIIGGIYLAMFMLQVSINLGVLFIGKLVIGFNLVNLHVVIINIALASIVSISLGLFITRIFENPGIASLSLTIIVVATTLISSMAVAGDSIRKIPWVMQNLAKFTPQYWLLDSLDKVKVFPNSLVLLLIALVLFTAGNLRTRSFINRV